MTLFFLLKGIIFLLVCVYVYMIVCESGELELEGQSLVRYVTLERAKLNLLHRGRQGMIRRLKRNRTLVNLTRSLQV